MVWATDRNTLSVITGLCRLLPRRIDRLHLVAVPLEAELLVPHDPHLHVGLESAGLISSGGLHLQRLPGRPRADDMVPVSEGRQLGGQAHHVIINGGLPSDGLLPRLHVPLQCDMVDGALWKPLLAAINDPMVSLRGHARAQDKRILICHFAGGENLKELVLVHHDLELLHTSLAQGHREDVAAGLLHKCHLLWCTPAIEGANAI
mmetsp:Transcript_77509/g.187738  ORF Transcript_77509/g.187738 Transcript_77509/m.187738 type:complete len:205 (-) Transcript_77509:2629-3243(-)